MRRFSMTVPTVAFSVVMSGATPVTSAVSDKVPISIVKFTRSVCLDVQLGRRACTVWKP